MLSTIVFVLAVRKLQNPSTLTEVKAGRTYNFLAFSAKTRITPTQTTRFVLATQSIESDHTWPQDHIHGRATIQRVYVWRRRDPTPQQSHSLRYIKSSAHRTACALSQSVPSDVALNTYKFFSAGYHPSLSTPPHPSPDKKRAAIRLNKQHAQQLHKDDKQKQEQDKLSCHWANIWIGALINTILS